MQEQMHLCYEWQLTVHTCMLHIKNLALTQRHAFQNSTRSQLPSCPLRVRKAVLAQPPPQAGSSLLPPAVQALRTVEGAYIKHSVLGS